MPTGQANKTTTQQERSSQRDRAYRQLRRLLVLHQLPAGQRLREEAYAEQLGVHRTALREAFARLEAEGFLSLGPKTGYFVPSLSPEDIQQIIEVRLGLENVAIDRICRLKLNTVKNLAPLQAACDQLERLIGEDYALAVVESDRRFHEALIEAAGNERLVLLYCRAPLPIIHRQVVERSEWDRSARQTLAEHRAILAAIREGKAAKARELLNEHLTARWQTPLPEL